MSVAMQFLLTYGIALLLFLAADAVWLGVIAKDLYRQQIGHLMAAQVRWEAAVIFYLLFLAGLMIFAIVPGLEAGSVWTATWKGALLGLLCYATYDLTNLATLQGWPTRLVWIDLAWGTALSAFVSGVTTLVASRWLDGR
jgi:uncharacterized membrane protein